MSTARLEPPATTFAHTADGWAVALHHYVPKERAHRHPVLLCHGLASNHRTFDLGQGPSLARHLARCGYSVYAVDLRGRGESRPLFARARGRVHRWTFDDYLHRDLPAAIAHITDREHCERVHWIGHSMGGLLALAHLAEGGSTDVCSVVTVASSLDYSSGTGFAAFKPALPLLRWLPRIPISSVARVSRTVSPYRATPFERLNVVRDNIEPAVYRRLCDSVFQDVSPPVMVQLATALEPKGLRSADGARHYLEGLRRARSPVLGVAGSHDRQCPPPAVEATFSSLGGDAKEVLVFGKRQGQAHDYGHFDLLLGRHAESEVFGPITRFVTRHDVSP